MTDLTQHCFYLTSLCDWLKLTRTIYSANEKQKGFWRFTSVDVNMYSHKIVANGYC